MGEVRTSKKGKFENFGPKDWIEYYESLNAEIPVEKIRLKLNDEEKKCYIEDLGVLKEERKSVPEVSYEIKYTWIE